MKPKADPLQFGGALLPFFFLMSDFRFAIKPSSSHKSWKKSFRCNDCTKACRDGFGSCAFRLACPGHVFHNFAQRTDFFKSNLKPYFNACPSGASTFPCPFGSFGAALASTGGVGHAVEKKKCRDREINNILIG